MVELNPEINVLTHDQLARVGALRVARELLTTTAGGSPLSRAVQNPPTVDELIDLAGWILNGAEDDVDERDGVEPAGAVIDEVQAFAQAGGFSLDGSTYVQPRAVPIPPNVLLRAGLGRPSTVGPIDTDETTEIGNG